MTYKELWEIAKRQFEADEISFKDFMEIAKLYYKRLSEKKETESAIEKKDE